MDTTEIDLEDVGLVTNKKAPRRRKKIPQFGIGKKRGRLLRDSRNLRFKSIYKPVSWAALLIFLGIVGFLYWFLHFHVPSRNPKNK